MAKGNISVSFDRVKGCFIGLNEDVISRLKKTYVGVNVDLELNKMQLWLNSPKGKKRKGHLGFIMNWLKNVEPVIVPDERDTPLRLDLDEYLEDLWERCRHVLEFNTIRKKI
jgi:hypothetical protein